MRKRGFTLVEILITLGVIGVVAAITLPTLIKNYQKFQAVNGLKRAYSTLSNAIQMSEVENGPVSTWTNVDGGAFETYIHPYLKTSYFCENCQVNYEIHKNFNGSTCSSDVLLCNSQTNIVTPYIIYTPDGMVWGFKRDFSGSSSSGDNSAKFLQVHVDINGPSKPNKYGKDIFMFEISPKYGLRPYGYGMKGETYNRWRICPAEGFTGSSIHDCTKTASYGFFCTADIVCAGWKIRDNYPW